MLNPPPAYDSVRESGAYDQLPPDVQAQLLDLPSYLPPSAQAKADDAMTMHLEKPETWHRLLDEVEALADSAAKVDQAFERVRQGLGGVDANHYKNKDDKPIPKLQPTWVGYQKRWTALLWGSRDIATKTEAYIKDFLEVILPGVEDIKTKDDLEDASTDLDAFIRREDLKQLDSQETVNLAQKYSQDFTDLIRDLETFKGTFDKIFAKNHNVELGVAITEKQPEIKMLDQEIKRCETVVMTMGIALGATIRVAHAGAVGALAGLRPIGPYVAIGVVIIGAVAAISELGVILAYVAETEAKKAQRARAQKQLAGLQAQLKDLKALQATLETQVADIPEICGRLDRISAIWGVVKHDAELIQSGLNTALSDKESNKALQKRMHLMKAVYTQLRDALNVYATIINFKK